ncbi:hypothetical protein E2C01_043055 [Portunus trituberculatus]|uniref:Uncharacterized protein n=1 Tax=Portunus trituberculatus TaxID=210409 RepID=A0A5B7FV23_PORTR|nr:hypothetical protein [Portunus trituberculatus]
MMIEAANRTIGYLARDRVLAGEWWQGGKRQGGGIGEEGAGRWQGKEYQRRQRGGSGDSPLKYRVLVKRYV